MQRNPNADVAASSRSHSWLLSRNSQAHRLLKNNDTTVWYDVVVINSDEVVDDVLAEALDFWAMTNEVVDQHSFSWFKTDEQNLLAKRGELEAQLSVVEYAIERALTR